MNFFILLIFTKLVAIGLTHTDLTLEDKAFGKEVVEAVLSKIERSSIFPEDSSFLLRIAYVESRFGEDENTFRPNYYGGIWQVDSEGAFADSKDTNKYPQLNAIYSNITKTFGIDWHLIKWENCVKPLVSALAARLSLFTKLSHTLEYLGEQAFYWSNSYNGVRGNGGRGTKMQFIKVVREMELKDLCRGHMDLVIVLDGSGSIDPSDFELAKRFVVNLTNTFSMENVSIGFITFSTTANIVIPLNNSLTRNEMESTILDVSYPSGGTDTDDAITKAVDLMRNLKEREGIPKIIAVFTDGGSNSGVKNGMAQVIANNITTFSIGIGTGINELELLEIAQGIQSHRIKVTDFEELSHSFALINSKTCDVIEAAKSPKPGDNLLIEVPIDEINVFCFNLPEEGLTLTIEVSLGQIITYYSYTYSKPSAALNDGIITTKKCIPYKPTSTANNVCITIKGVKPRNSYTLKNEHGCTDPCVCINYVGTHCGDRVKDEIPYLRGNCIKTMVYYCAGVDVPAIPKSPCAFCTKNKENPGMDYCALRSRPFPINKFTPLG